MAYIIERKNRFYVVAYDGIDPATGRERWHPAGHRQSDAETIRARLDAVTAADATIATGQVTFGRYLNEQFMPMRRNRIRATTAHRYQWMIDHYITPALGTMPLRSVRSEHLDRLYNDLLTTGGVKHAGLAPKTVYHIPVVIRSAFTQAVRQHLVTENPALGAQPPRARLRQRSEPECWTTEQLAVEVAVKTRTSRRCIDLGSNTEEALRVWRRRQQRDGHPTGPNEPIFTNTAGQPVHPESIYQLFHRQVRRLDMPRICFHGQASSDVTPPRGSPRRRRHPDQGRVRTARSPQPRVHDGHLPTRDARHGR